MVVEEAGEEEEAAEAADLLELRKRKRLREKKLLADLAKLMPTTPNAAAVSSFCDTKKMSKKVINPGPAGFTELYSKRFLPPVCDIDKYVGEKEARWKVWSPPFQYKTKSRSRMFGVEVGVTDYEAMRFVIMLAWAQEERKGSGRECPWEFLDEDPEGDVTMGEE